MTGYLSPYLGICVNGIVTVDWGDGSKCPFTVMESEARGTPVVGAKVGGIPELIEDDINGRLFERKDSNGLAKIIKNLWNNHN